MSGAMSRATRVSRSSRASFVAFALAHFAYLGCAASQAAKEGPPADPRAVQPGQGWFCHRSDGPHIPYPCHRDLAACENRRKTTDRSGESVGECERASLAYCMTWTDVINGRRALGAHCELEEDGCETFKVHLQRYFQNPSRCDPYR